MKPASFSYHRPQGLDEAFQLLDTYADEAKIIAGGQSLVPMMNMRLARPGHLIDITRLPELNQIQLQGDRIRIGALCRQIELENSPILQQQNPLIPYTVSKIGHYAIRQRGTIGGSLAHADPAAELPLMAALFNATLEISSSEGTRSVLAEEFFITIYTTDLLPTEILTAVEFPILQRNEGWSYLEFSRRAGDYAIVSVASTLRLDEQGQVADMRMALGGVEAIPFNAGSLIASYLGEKPTALWMRSLADEVTAQLEPNTDIHATQEDRIELLHLLIQQSLQQSLARIGQRGDLA